MAFEAAREVPDPALLAYAKAKDKDGFVADLSGKTALAFATYQLRLSTQPNGAFYEVCGPVWDIGKGLVTLRPGEHLQVTFE